MRTATLNWFQRTFVDLARHVRWSYLPPLMVYFSAGVSGLTSIVGTFFIKDYLDLSAAFIAGLGFWVGLPWVLKMPLGHLVDLIWRWKAALVWLGALMIALSLGIMYGLIARPEVMRQVMPIQTWFVLAALISPMGYVIQDVVADAMTVEAVPSTDPTGSPYTEDVLKNMHTTMQTLGRFAIISGLVLVASVNIFMFADTEAFSLVEKSRLYARIYLIALTIPVISISGVVLHALLLRVRERQMRAEGASDETIAELIRSAPEAIQPNWQILGGGLAFAVCSAAIGLVNLDYSQEIVFAGSLAIILFLISRLLRELPKQQANALIGTATIIFVFRAVPLPGPGLSWFEIDILGFDEGFLSLLSLITACLTLTGLIVLRPLMAKHSIAFIVVVLTIAAGILSLPNIGLYYGLHEWTSARTGGAIDARFIAILDTAIESPLGQIAMVPMLAWIARNAPAHLKATFFAVMASFTNLALAASSLATRYLNDLFVVTREVTGDEIGAVTVAADYSNLGVLLITVAGIALAAPLLMVIVVQLTRFRTDA